MKQVSTVTVLSLNGALNAFLRQVRQAGTFACSRYVTTGQRVSPSKVHFPWGTWTYLVHGYLDPYQPSPKWHIDWFNHFA